MLVLVVQDSMESINTGCYFMPTLSTSMSPGHLTMSVVHDVRSALLPQRNHARIQTRTNSVSTAFRGSLNKSRVFSVPMSSKGALLRVHISMAASKPTNPSSLDIDFLPPLGDHLGTLRWCLGCFPLDNGTCLPPSDSSTSIILRHSELISTW